MLGAVLWSFVGALLCTMIIVGIGFARNRKGLFESGLEVRIEWAIVIFITEFVGLVLILYVACKPQNIITVIRWSWVPLLIDFLFNFVYCLDNSKDFSTEAIVTGTIIIISGTVCFTTLFVPVQNSVYVHDMEKVDITYAISSDELLAKMELKIDNSQFREEYRIEAPEMRRVNGKDIAVYKIEDDYDGNTEYIPGYAIQEKNELPKIISKRIYFDTSYHNKWDALRTVRRKYPTVIIGEHKFDIDDEWNPYEVFEYRENLFFTNGKDYGIIVLNLMDGTCEKYPEEENKTPDWVDFKTTYPR